MWEVQAVTHSTCTDRVPAVCQVRGEDAGVSDRWIPETLSQAQAGLRDPRLEVPATWSLHSGGEAGD